MTFSFVFSSLSCHLKLSAIFCCSKISPFLMLSCFDFCKLWNLTLKIVFIIFKHRWHFCILFLKLKNLISPWLDLNEKKTMKTGRIYCNQSKKGLHELKKIFNTNENKHVCLKKHLTINNQTVTQWFSTMVSRHILCREFLLMFRQVNLFLPLALLCACNLALVYLFIQNCCLDVLFRCDANKIFIFKMCVAI